MHDPEIGEGRTPAPEGFQNEISVALRLDFHEDENLSSPRNWKHQWLKPRLTVPPTARLEVAPCQNNR
jgi:hypothetical protein